MAIVKSFGPRSGAAFAQFVDENSPSWVTRSGSEIHIDGGILKIIPRWVYGDVVQTTRNDSQIYQTVFTWSSAIGTICYNENLFWLQLGDGDSKRVCVVYEKFSNGLTISDVRGTHGSSGTMDFQPINNFSLIDAETSQVYTHNNILNYSVPLGCIDYGPDVLFTGSVITNIIDSSFVTCSAITQNQVITFNGANYYSVGPHTLVPIDSEV